MKIKSLKIKSFLGIREWSAAFDRKIAFVHGPNASGKSSIRDAILFALTGKARGVEKKKDAAFLANRNDPTGLRVEIEFADGFKVTRSASAVTPTQGIIDEKIRPELAGVVMNAFRFPELTTAERRDLVRGLQDPAELAGKVRQALAATGLTDAVITEVIAIVPTGLDRAEAFAVEKRRESKRRLEETTLLQNVEKITKIEDVEYDLSTIAIDDVRENLTAVQKEHSDIVQRIGCAKIFDLDELKKKQAEIGRRLDAAGARIKGDTMAKVESEIAAIEREKMAAEVNLNRLLDAYASLSKLSYCPLHKELECPIKGPQRTQIIRGIADNGTSARKRIKELEEKLPALRERLKAVKDCAELERQHQSILDEITKTPQENIPALETEKSALEKRVEIGVTLLREVDRYRQSVAAAESAKNLAATLEHDVASWDNAAKSLGKDSTLRRDAAKGFDVARAVRGVVDHLLPGRKLEVDDDYEPRLDGVPLQLLSRSERFRVGIAFADAISHAAGLRLLVIDECDILRGESQYGLFGFLHSIIPDYDTIIILATTETETEIDINDPDFQVFRSYRK